MKTLILKVCGFYIAHNRLKQLSDLGATNCLNYKDLGQELKHALNNMSGTITLTQGSKKAKMEQKDNQFEFEILYVSGLSVHGVNETYPEIQFGTNESGEFRLITEPSITREQINEFLGFK